MLNVGLDASVGKNRRRGKKPVVDSNYSNNLVLFGRKSQLKGGSYRRGCGKDTTIMHTQPMQSI
jgi:hypothetical protein